MRRILALVTAALSFPSLPVTAASWLTNNPLAVGRQNQTATLLSNGKVLIAGGWNGSSAVASAELFDPATGRSQLTGPMTTNRYYHTATLLRNGKVLVAGGSDNTGRHLASAELFDVSTGTWTNTGSMNTARYFHTATLLANGQVLVAGGYNGNVFSSAEIYDPLIGQWTITASMNTNRGNHTATLLPDGKVLVAGGWNGDINITGISSVEVYDPVLVTWTVTNSLNTPRQNHTATLLPGSKVLVAGGAGRTGVTNSVELFDPNTGAWAAINSMKTNRQLHTATLLPNGKLLVAVGSNAGGSLNSAELYDPNGIVVWATTATLNVARESHTATMLANGRVLLAGGRRNSAVTNSTEVYDYASGSWTGTGALGAGRTGHRATFLPDDRVLVTGNSIFADASTAEVYVPDTGVWTNVAPMNSPHYLHTATLLAQGSVLICGGENLDWSATTNCDLFDPGSGGWTQTGSLGTGRYWHTASLLRNGKVLVTGGYDYQNNLPVYLSSSELYNPSTRTWSATGPLIQARSQHTATVLPNGKVLIAGGINNGFGTSSAELYDPVTGAFAATGNLNVPRWSHTATILAGGLVLVAGGDTGYAFNGGTTVSTCELYDPSLGTWRLTGAMTAPHGEHMSALLPNGKVLVAGGFVQGTGASSSCELYDPATGKWSATANMSGLRSGAVGALLLNGKVLRAGGFDGSGSVPDSALYDPGFGSSPASAPQIISVTSPLNPGDSVGVTGANFQRGPEGSSGDTRNSSADYPLLQMRNIHNDQVAFVRAANWSSNTFLSQPLWNFPPGYALATVFVEGVQSTSAMVNVAIPTPTITALGPPSISSGSCHFGFTNTPGAFFGVLTSTNVLLPSSDWSAIGGVTELSPGQYEFTDSRPATSPQRFYRLYSP